jgi:hypothetical protein
VSSQQKLIDFHLLAQQHEQPKMNEELSLH